MVSFPFGFPDGFSRLFPLWTPTPRTSLDKLETHHWLCGRLHRSVASSFFYVCFAFLFVVSISCISEVDLCLFSILFLTEEYLTGQRFIHCRLWIESKRSCSSFTTTTTNVESNAVSMSSHPISSEKRKGHKSIVLVTSGIIMYMGRVFSSFIVISQS